jgi:hypothetical protein
MQVVTYLAPHHLVNDQRRLLRCRALIGEPAPEVMSNVGRIELIRYSIKLAQ